MIAPQTNQRSIKIYCDFRLKHLISSSCSGYPTQRFQCRTVSETHESTLVLTKFPIHSQRHLFGGESEDLRAVSYGAGRAEQTVLKGKTYHDETKIAYKNTIEGATVLLHSTPPLEFLDVVAKTRRPERPCSVEGQGYSSDHQGCLSLQSAARTTQKPSPAFCHVIVIIHL